MAVGVDNNEEDRKRYFREIGLHMAVKRADMLERRAGSLYNSRAVASSPSREVERQHNVQDMNPKKPLGVKHDAISQPTTLADSASVRFLRVECEEARRELNDRIRKLRQELLEETRAVQEQDAQDLKKADYRHLCISQGLRGSVAKMRRNLVQRRVNMTIFEKQCGDWSLPQIRQELRRKRRYVPDGTSLSAMAMGLSVEKPAPPNGIAMGLAAEKLGPGHAGALVETPADVAIGSAVSGAMPVATGAGNLPAIGAAGSSVPGVVGVPGIAVSSVAGEDLLGP